MWTLSFPACGGFPYALIGERESSPSASAQGQHPTACGQETQVFIEAGKFWRSRLNLNQRLKPTALSLDVEFFSMLKKSMKIKGTYTPTKWDEKPYQTESAQKQTRATVEFAFSGDIVGTANVEYLMFYKSFDPADAHKAVAEYVGLMRLTGTHKGEPITLALTDHGAYESGAANSKLSVIAGSGRGEFAQVSGGGSYRADQSGCSWELEVFL